MWGKPSDAAAEAAVWGLIETEAKKRKDEARAWLTEQMGPDLLAVSAVVNGETVGRATYVQGKTSPLIVDEDAFLKFVEQYYPSEIVTAVNRAFKIKLLAELHQVDGGLAVDSNGVLVGGVEFCTGGSYVTVRKSQDAREKVAALLAGGGVSLDGLKAIES